MSAVFCQSLVWDQKWVMGRLKLALKLLSRKNWCQNSSAMLCWKTPGLAAGWMWAKDFHTSLLGESAYHSEHGVEINSFQFRFIVLRGGKFLKPRVKKKKRNINTLIKAHMEKSTLWSVGLCAGAANEQMKYQQYFLHCSFGDAVFVSSTASDITAVHTNTPENGHSGKEDAHCVLRHVENHLERTRSVRRLSLQICRLILGSIGLSNNWWFLSVLIWILKSRTCEKEKNQ